MRSLALFFILVLLASLAGPVFAADDAKARGLLNSLGCKGCHRFEGSGGTFGPPLDGVGTRLTRSQIEVQMLTPKAANPTSMMPAYGHLTEEDLAALFDFLQSQK